MAEKKLIYYYFIIGIAALITAILFTGFFTDPEDGDGAFFVKHKPALKCRFYSPEAAQRFYPRPLTIEERIDEAMFREFIIERDIIEKELASPFIPGVLLQLSLTFLLACFVMYLKNMLILPALLIVHFLLNILFSTFILGIIAFMDESFNMFLCFMLLVFINFISMLGIMKLFNKFLRSLSYG